MNSVDRHRFIMNQLQEQESVSVQELCERLGVSSVTIRKDLKLLEDRHMLYRTHGGAILNNPYTIDRTVFEKEKLQSAQKQAIGRHAAALITADDSIIIASGTTVQAMAREILPAGNLTVVTSALNVALQLIQHPNVEILQLGGTLRKTSTSVAGPYAEQILQDFFCSKLFLGVDGIDLELGLTTTSAQEAQLNRQMIAASQKTIVLADSSKFGKRGFGRICDVKDIDEIITDAGIPATVKKAFVETGVQVTIV